MRTVHSEVCVLFRVNRAPFTEREVAFEMSLFNAVSTTNNCIGLAAEISETDVVY